jgi:DNA-binding IclR family transcriptional regulator
MRTVTRVAEDCLPPNRLAILRCLRRAGKPLTSGEISRETGLPPATADRTLEDLKVLGILSSRDRWELHQNWAERLRWVKILE